MKYGTTYNIILLATEEQPMENAEITDIIEYQLMAETSFEMD